MEPSLFRQSFLIDSLYDDSDPDVQSFTCPTGVTLKRWSNGIIEAIPSNMDENTQHIIVSCGVHGNETGPMELVSKIVSDIESGDQQVQERMLFVIANIEAIKQNVRFIEENLNRLFDDKGHEPTRELVIADNLKFVVKDFWQDTPIANRWHFDLHCTIRESKHYTFAVSPKVRNRVRTEKLLSFLQYSHINALVLSNAPSSTFSWYTAEQFSAQALTVELGRVARLGQNDLKPLVAFDITLRDLIARESSEHLAKHIEVYRVSRTIVRMHDDFQFLFDDDVPNFTGFFHGEVFGNDGDKPLMAKNEGEAVLFPNPSVAVGQRAALMVCKTTIRFEDGQFVYD